MENPTDILGGGNQEIEGNYVIRYRLGDKRVLRAFSPHNS